MGRHLFFAFIDTYVNYSGNGSTPVYLSILLRSSRLGFFGL